MTPDTAPTIVNSLPDSLRKESVRLENAAAQQVVPETDTGLAPQTLSGLFDEAFDMYKLHFTTIALSVAVVYLPTLALFDISRTVWLRPLLIAMQEQQGDAAALTGLKLAFFFLTALAVLLFGTLLASGPGTVAVSACSQGRPISLREAFRLALPAFPRLAAHGAGAIAAMLCATAAALFLGFILLGLCAIVLSGLGGETLSVVVALLSILLLFIAPYLCGCALTARFFLLAPALTTLENLQFSPMMERNGSLARKAGFRRVWLAAIFLPLVTLGLLLLASYAADSVIDALRLGPFLAFAAHSGALALFSFLVQPYWITFLCLLYFDCRTRRDGLDVSRLADAAGLPHPSGPLPESPTLAVPLTIYNVPASAPLPPYVPPPYQHGNILPGGKR